jgi:IMP cyclohydrolase
MTDLKQLSLQNVNTYLKHNVYPGRGIIVGQNASGTKLVQVYWIMGRSENSRNRVFTVENNILKTKPFDLSKCKDPSLIIYNAMRQVNHNHIVSNGDQTDTIFNAFAADSTFEEALASRDHEPDAPNYTPRISALAVWQAEVPNYRMNILKTQNNNPTHTQHQMFYYKNFIPGFGHCFHTYAGDGNPLPSFSGEPYIVPVAETIDEIVRFYWDVLDKENRISLAVKTIDVKNEKIEFKVINKLS